VPSDTAAQSPGSLERGPAEAGIRTFLIADVRGYTRFTQEHGDEEAGALAAQFAELAREAVAGRHGQVLELRGDEALCVFSSARQALRAAVDFQARSRTSTDEGPVFPLGIGIGLDAGEAVPIEGGYRGGALNLAARLCSLAKPGEILASETVVGLAGRLEGVRFVGRRPVRLKGMERPVRVTEVVPTEPLPPTSFPARKGRLESRWLVGGTVVAIALVGALVGLGIARSTGQKWLAAVHANGVGVIDPGAGRIADEAAVGGGPGAIAAGAGSLWVTNDVDGTVSRLDPQTRNIQTIPVGANPTAIAVGEGFAWVANSQDRTVSQISPDANRVVRVVPVGNGPRAVATGAGAVWVANGVDGTISRIDPAKSSVTATVPVGPNPSGIAVVGRTVWVTSEATGTVSELDPSSNAIVRTVGVGNAPSAIASGEGAIWVANAQDSTISRIDPVKGSVTEAVRTGRNPRALAVGLGVVWVANTDDGTVTKVDATSRTVEKTISVGSSPTAIAVAAGSVWTTSVSTPASHRGGILRVGLGEFWACECFDPSAVWNGDAWQVLANVYDGLVGFRRTGGAQGGTLVPDLATSVPAPTDGGKTYTFQLRPGMRFSDGRPVRASDVRASLERVYKASYGFSNVPFYGGIVGAGACAENPKACDLSQGVETDDDTGTIVIHLSRSDPDFLFKLALPFASVLPAGSPAGIDRGQRLFGTGPYKLASFDAKRELRLVRNPRFRVWSREAQPAGYPDEIRVRIDDDPDGQINAVTSGAADYVGGLPPERLTELSTRYAGQLHSDPFAAVDYVFIRTSISPFDDVRVRKALNYAVDRRRLVTLLGGSLAAQPTCQFLPPNLPGYRPYCAYTLDPNPAGIWTAPDVAEANRLVELSGTRGMRVQMIADSSRERTARYIVGLLRQLGYRASLRVFQNYADYYDYIIGRRFPHAQLATAGWVADYAAPANFLQVVFSCRGFHAIENHSGFCNQRIDALIEDAAAAQIVDPARGLALWARADRAIADHAPVVFLDNPRSLVLVSKRVGNYQSHPQFGVLLDQLWLR
jgi:YVTN family beta-propeller protein